MQKRKATATNTAPAPAKTQAGPCPKCGPKFETQTKVYNKTGRVRHCKCNRCGHTWKRTGPHADRLREYAVELADSLKKAEREDLGDGPIVLLTDELARQIETELRDRI